MTQYLDIHPENPQQRLLDKAAAILDQGGVVVYPTDTTYGLGCAITNRKGVQKILKLKELPASHQLSFICPNLADIAKYARVDSWAYRMLKRLLPGPFTFVLDASREVPKHILPKRKTIGLRIPDNPTCLGLLETFGQPILSTTLRLPGGDVLTDPELIRDDLKGRVDLIVAGGILPNRPSTVVSLTEGYPEILREGAGDPSLVL